MTQEKAELLWDGPQAAAPYLPPWDDGTAEIVDATGSTWWWNRQTAAWHRTTSLHRSVFPDGNHRDVFAAHPPAPSKPAAAKLPAEMEVEGWDWETGGDLSVYAADNG